MKSSVSSEAQELLELERQARVRKLSEEQNRRWLELTRLIFGDDEHRGYMRRSSRVPASSTATVNIGAATGIACRIEEVSHINFTMKGTKLGSACKGDELFLETIEVEGRRIAVGLECEIKRVAPAGKETLIGVEILPRTLPANWSKHVGEVYYPFYLRYLQNLAGGTVEWRLRQAPAQPSPPVAPSGSKWILPGGDPNADLRLFCFPYLGGAAQIFMPWKKTLSPGVELCPIQPPGRWERISEPAIQSFDGLIEAVTEGLRPYLDKPFAVVGYSLGALVAYRWILNLRAKGLPLPRCFFPAACAAPKFASPLLFGQPSINLDDGEMLTRLQAALGGIPEALMQDQVMRAMFVPIIRADLAVMESFRFREEAPLDVPIIGLAGAADPIASSKQIDAWEECSRAEFKLELFQGDHFFIHSDTEKAVPKTIVGHLARWAGSSSLSRP